MRVVIRVDASLKMGTGHVMRCLTLAEVLKENEADVEFICRKHKGNLINKIRSNGFNVFEFDLPLENKVDNKLFHSHWLGTTQQQDAIDCIGVLQSAKADWLIVDHYGIDEDWQQDLKAYYDKLMVIDDLADRKHKCDILLDQTFGRQQQDYEEFVPKSCELLLGSQFALLRPEFAKWRQYSLERRKYPVFKQLLINMGGTDPENFTGEVLIKLKECNLSIILEVIILMGKTSPHIETVRNEALKLPCAARVKVGVNNMAEIMANADIAIGASGATTWERCCLGLPAIQIITAHNQQTIANHLDKINAIKLSEIKDLPITLKTAKNLLVDFSANASRVCDGSGAPIVARYLL